MEKKERFVYAGIDVEEWLARLPSAASVRPGQCIACRAASRPVGGPVVLHGHGVRARVCRGPANAASGGESRIVLIRRYLCSRCGAVTVVAPRGLLPRRLYAAAAIGLALGLWGLQEKPSAEVRAQVGHPGSRLGQRRWRTLGRWAASAGEGRVFSEVQVATGRVPRQALAARVASALIGWVPPTCRALSAEAQYYLGGAHAA